MGKISISEFSMSKLSYVAVFTKIQDKCFDRSCKTFLTNWGKNEDEDEKLRIMNSTFEFSMLKLDYVPVFMKIWEIYFRPILSGIND